MDKELEQELSAKMQKAIGIFEKDLSGLRAGRASAHLLDPVVVEVYNSKMPISQVGTVSTPDAKTITVQVWDKELVKKVEKAITEANLGLNPVSDGQLIRINLPTVSEERRKELVRVAHKYAENTRVALRNVRREGMDILKKQEKDNEISKDEHHALGEDVQKLTNKFTDIVDDMLKKREKEIMTT